MVVVLVAAVGVDDGVCCWLCFRVAGQMRRNYLACPLSRAQFRDADTDPSPNSARLFDMSSTKQTASIADACIEPGRVCIDPVYVSHGENAQNPERTEDVRQTTNANISIFDKVSARCRSFCDRFSRFCLSICVPPSPTGTPTPDDGR